MAQKQKIRLYCLYIKLQAINEPLISIKVFVSMADKVSINYRNYRSRLCPV
jgi:hypothetical protein